MWLSSIAVFGLFALCAAYIPDGAYTPSGSPFIGGPYGNKDNTLDNLKVILNNLVVRQQVLKQRVNTLTDSSSDSLLLESDFLGVGLQDFNDEKTSQNERLGRLDNRVDIVTGISNDVDKLQQFVQKIQNVLKKSEDRIASIQAIVNPLNANVFPANENITEIANQGNRINARAVATLDIAESNAANISTQELLADQFRTTINFNAVKTYQLDLNLTSGFAKANLPFPNIPRNTGSFANGFSFDFTGKRYNYGNETLSFLLSDDAAHDIEVRGYDLSQNGWKTNVVYATVVATRLLTQAFDIEAPFDRLP